jgi:hypothetical protein
MMPIEAVMFFISLRFCKILEHSPHDKKDKHSTVKGRTPRENSRDPIFSFL